MKSIIKKGLISLVICFGIAFPTIITYAATNYEEYTKHFTISDKIYIGGKVEANTKFYCGKGSFSVTTRISSQTKPEQASSKYFYVKVYRCDLITDSYIGAGIMNRSGTTTESWKNMKHDTYRFLLDKSDDGCVLDGSVSLYY